MSKPIIALDADGVLLDYHVAYRNAWHKAFNDLPALKDPNAYWPLDRWNVRKLEGDELVHFRRFFNDEFWRTIPAVEGAIQACNQLETAGFELICISAIESEFQDARLDNLTRLGFPIQRVIATSGATGATSPKAPALSLLSPIVFVDDFLPYHRGVPPEIHRALITRETNGTPNIGEELSNIDSSHRNLREFTDWWLVNSQKLS
ncbi:HAD family hydrolase [Undibacterium sp. LX40W]|uniref:HAD family hydrolase n=1 Tax=Undibacterium nitidum TaxID=2762298 RepID=A0A923HRX8_9BURK|nr:MULTISPECIES: HAD family hydrolase [Undibacterium]MBC3879969.1 HAD family hydrolase [Undibacterium nitidum]MBC3891295.1 HAD family hydrolase [Undibacterium sp. LX40W]